MPISTSQTALWEIDASKNAKYGSGYSAGASLNSSNVIIYKTESVTSANVVLSNINSNPSVSGSTVQLSANNFAGNVAVTSNSSNYAFSLASGTYNKSFTGTDSADTITNNGSNVTIYGGAGDDTITNSGSNVSINGGADNDTINLTSGSNITVNVGEGNDTINVASGVTSLTVENFSVGDEIKLASSVSAIGDASIGGLSLAEENTAWSLSGGTASLLSTRGVGAYLDSDNKTIKYASSSSTLGTLGTLTNIYSLSGLSIASGSKVITISSVALSGASVALTTDKGYTLAIVTTGNNSVDTVKEDLTGWHDNNGSATYYTNRWGEYYSLESSATALNYYASIAGTSHVAISGLSTANLAAPTNDSVVNLNANDFSDDVAVTFNGSNYKFSLATGTYNHKFTGLSDAANSIENAGSQITILGGASADSIENTGSSVTIDADDGDDTITNSGNAVSINAGLGNDSITNSGNNVSIFGGGNDTVSGFNATSKLILGLGNDTFSTAKSGDKDIIVSFEINSVKNSVKIIDGAKLGNIHEQIIGVPVNAESMIKYNNKKKPLQSTSATLKSDFEGVLDANNYKKLKTVKVDKNLANDIKIIGNSKANKFTGGKGNDNLDGGAGNDNLDGGKGDDTLIGGRGKDTLKGGAGADTFVYSEGDGHDVIKDYTPGEDTLQITGTIKSGAVKGSNVILKIGGGDLTLEKAVGKKVTFANGTERIYRKEGEYNGDETELKIFSTFKGEYKADQYKYLEVIDGSNVKSVKSALKITGNDNDNSITGGAGKDTLDGGKGDDTLIGGNGSDYLKGGEGDDSLDGGIFGDTLIGGAGDDTLTGGSGIDVFVYESGDDVITDFFADTNKISLVGGNKVSTDYKLSGGDLVLNFDSDSLTIKEYDGREVKFTDGKSYVFTENALYNGEGTKATLKANNFTADDKILNIDGSQVDGKLNIEGNFRNNAIIGNDDGGTLIGGGGNDSLWGGEGSDTFIYDAGDGNDIIFGFGDKDVLTINSIDDILPVYKSGAVKINCGSGSITLKNFTTNEFTINGETWTLSKGKFIK